MAVSKRGWSAMSALLVAALLSACGGGSSTSGNGSSGTNTTTTTTSNGNCSSTVSSTPSQIVAGNSSTNPPAYTGNTALDGYNWINYRRAQTGLPVLNGNSTVAAAAQNHSDYQKYNNVVSHYEVASNTGFTGCALPDRLHAVGYNLSTNLGYAYGEVISAATEGSGFVLAENLFTAIYHRFVMLEPNFKEGGAGSSTAASGYTYFTADLSANNGYGPGLASGKIVTFPFAGQTQVPVNFFSDTETPDPVPNQNEVGYPVSVHTNIDSIIAVQTFTIQARGGSILSTRLLTNSSDPNPASPDTPKSGAAIIPMLPLHSSTLYDVIFSGSVDGVAVTRNWSFTTQ